MTGNLRFCMYAARDLGQGRHPQAVMNELGITYKEAVPQSMADQWWFFGCENVPDPLPAFLSAMPDGKPHA